MSDLIECAVCGVEPMNDALDEGWSFYSNRDTFGTVKSWECPKCGSNSLRSLLEYDNQRAFEMGPP